MSTRDLTDDICLTNVTKVFTLGIWKKKLAVANLSLRVTQGQVVGLLGPNGSGKSTTIKMILGFLKPTSGEIKVCGHSADEKEARARIGYLPENPRFQKFLCGSDILNYYGGLLGLSGGALRKRREKLLELVGLKHACDERVQGYSKGMTQRLAIAQALLNEPSLLIFDEPMSGLDPLGRMEIRKLIQQVHQEMPSTTIFFSTHILEDVEQLCSAVALLKKGSLQIYCTIEELLSKEQQKYQLVVRDVSPSLRQRIAAESDPKDSPLGLTLSIDGNDMLVRYLQDLSASGAKVIGVHSQRITLEEALFTDKNITAQVAKSELGGVR